MDKYIKIKKIGEGSFGKALLVKRKDNGKQCVIKEISISRMAPKERQDSRKEVKVLSQLKHPNIVTYQESFEGMGNLYIVMDYCEGGDLYQLITRQRGINIEESKVLDIFVQCCLAVKHIHDRKILHRDIKTQNIFLTKHNMVKLGDFGIARVLKNTMELARTCIGTPYYLSPEIVENRPYNNKSDIWSLGCVLYELATLKHAFEAGSMKNLVLKIVRGSYPPLPNRYSYELRSLVAHCFKRSPSDRPSINTLLKKPIIQQRIANLLSPEVVEEEFNHTILHRQKFNPPRPISAIAAVKNMPAAKKAVGPAAVYGVSVAKKAAPAKKPLSVVKPKRSSGSGAAVGQQRKISNKKELDARERRRKEVVLQEQQYQDYMKKIQKQRWEKQQANQMNRARESGWKNILGSVEEKKKADEAQLMNKNKNAMKKYQPYEQKVAEEKENMIVHEERPVKPIGAWSAANEGKQNAVKGAEAAEKARLLDEFWQRKKEALANKDRGNYVVYGKNQNVPETPLLQYHNNQMAEQGKRNDRPPLCPGVQKKQELDYLKQLEAIRKQNYIERKALRGGAKLLEQKKVENIVGDPRFDAEARRRKIEALKEQAEQRAVILRQQLEERRKQAQQRLDKERLERIRKNKEARKVNDRPLPNLKDVSKQEVNNKIVTPAVGLETAMNQMKPKLFRSCSEGDLKNIIKPIEHIRKNWGVVAPEPLALAHMTLEITSSAMEATTANENINNNVLSNKDVHRKQWGCEGKTQLVSLLHDIDLSGTRMPTMAENLSPSGKIGKTIIISGQPAKPGKTITVSSKKIPSEASKTITISPKCIEDVSSNDKILSTEEIGKTVTVTKDAGNMLEVDNNAHRSNNNENVTINVNVNKEKTKDEVEVMDVIDICQNETKSVLVKTPKSAWNDDGMTELVQEYEIKELNVVNEEEDLFYTPNHILGLQSGCYDAETKHLRTCSLPDLRQIHETSPNHSEDSEISNESPEEDNMKLKEIEPVNDIAMEDISDEENLEINNEDGDASMSEDDKAVEDAEKQENDDEEEVILQEENREADEEEIEEFESMLESMRNVLSNTSHSPTTTVVPKSVKDTMLPDEKSENTGANTMKNSFDNDEVEWESDDDGEENNEKTKKQKEKNTIIKENLFSKIEESRKGLEDELGMTLFIKVYRHVQTIQDNEDELELGSTAEINELLGDKGYLYQKILYLVLADSAYCEGNDGMD